VLPVRIAARALREATIEVAGLAAAGLAAAGLAAAGLAAAGLAAAGLAALASGTPAIHAVAPLLARLHDDRPALCGKRVLQARDAGREEKPAVLFCEHVVPVAHRQSRLASIVADAVGQRLWKGGHDFSKHAYHLARSDGVPFDHLCKPLVAADRRPRDGPRAPRVFRSTRLRRRQSVAVIMLVTQVLTELRNDGYDARGLFFRAYVFPRQK
jgi:hypothetical protein